MLIERVVFFQPRTFASSNYRTSAGSEQMWPPWAALVLAPIAQQARMTVTLVDARVEQSRWTSTLGELSPYDLLAITVMTGKAIHDAVLASEIAKSHGCRVIWGGPHVSLFPMETLEQAPVDAVIPGFGYEPLARLLGVINRDGWPKRSIDGVLVRSVNVNRLAVRKNYSAGTFPVPSASLDLITDWEPYINEDVAIASRTISSITSEGCSRRCTYCSEPQTSNSTWYTRDVSNVVKQTADLCQRSNANGVKFNDPNLFHD
ncbi:MAG TPA: hypothetical protein ENI62_00020, partial [Gammaproteobacteria bacterium]|nr:hypothetical protein [Gammaproteobacteria bacterium]